MRAGVRFDWGIAGARAAARQAGALVIVDVLSFSTATTIATGRGTAVYPHPWPSPDVAAFAAARDAARAVGRREVSERHPWSLSPAQLAAAPAAERLVLPSPNGSAIAAASTGRVLAGCLRNATAVARWLADSGYGTADHPVTVIAAGERWPGGELRPALEDLLGAAAVIAAFGPRHARSPEASATEAVWHVHRAQASEFLLDCPSGRELAGRGFTADVTLAAEHDTQPTIPVLTNGAFKDAMEDRRGWQTEGCGGRRAGRVVKVSDRAGLCDGFLSRTADATERQRRQNVGPLDGPSGRPSRRWGGLGLVG